MPRAPKYNLDFSATPKFASLPNFHALYHDTESRISILREVASRAEGAVYFSYCISSPPYASENNEQFRREACLRAAIAEFVSIEEALRRDLKELDSNVPTLSIKETDQPLLHAVRELRNLEMHLQTSQLESSKSRLKVRDILEPSRVEEKDVNVWHVDDMTVAKFKALNNARRYKAEQIPQLVQWFNEFQRRWGIDMLILGATELYCRMILETLPSTS